MAIGERLRRVRLASGLSLAALGRSSGLSKGFLSQVEGGSANPSVVSLQRIAVALSVPVSELLDAAPPTGGPSEVAVPSVVRRVAASASASSVTVGAHTPQGCMALARLEAGRLLAGGADGKAGITTVINVVACLFVVRGELLFKQEARTLRLGEGDSLTWDAGTAYTLQNTVGSACSMLLFVPDGVALPSVGRSPESSRERRAKLVVPVAAGWEGPLRLVAMRAARSGEMGR